MKTKEIQIPVDIFYQDYSWLEGDAKYDVSLSSYKQPNEEKRIKVAETVFTITVEDLETDENLLKLRKIEALEAKAAKVRELALKELESIENSIQELKGIEYVPEVTL